MSRIERGAAGSSGRGVHVVSSTTVRRSGAATGGRTGSTRRMGGAASPCPGQGRTGSSAPIERGYRVRGRILRPWPRCTAASGRGSSITSTSGPTASSSSAASRPPARRRHPGRDDRQLLRLRAGRDDGRRRDQGRDAPVGGLFYSTATIRQELERIAGGWPERAAEPALARRTTGSSTRSATTTRSTPTRRRWTPSAPSSTQRADGLFNGRRRGGRHARAHRDLAQPGDRQRLPPDPPSRGVRELAPEFHRLTVAEMLDDLERHPPGRARRAGAALVVTTSPVPLHSTFTPLDVRVANTESKCADPGGRLRVRRPPR